MSVDATCTSLSDFNEGNLMKENTFWNSICAWVDSHAAGISDFWNKI